MSRVNPIGMRLGINKRPIARWYAPPRKYAWILASDLQARAYLTKELAQSGVSSIHIERPGRNAKIIVSVARPGQVIGKKGEYVDRLRKHLEKLMGIPVRLSIVSVNKPELDAKLVAENVAQQLERRVMFRRAMKRAVSVALRLGAKGIKVSVSGRLGGAEIARTEWYREGRVPLHTFRANIDYALAEAKTTYGIIGVKVWIYKGDVFGFDTPETSLGDTRRQEGSQKKDYFKGPRTKKQTTTLEPSGVNITS
jgi:small subunit ribosomal protein S3